MIGGYAINGYDKDSIELFDMMNNLGTNPNNIYKPFYVLNLHAKCLTREKHNFMVYNDCTIHKKWSPMIA